MALGKIVLDSKQENGFSIGMMKNLLPSRHQVETLKHLYRVASKTHSSDALRLKSEWKRAAALRNSAK